MPLQPLQTKKVSQEMCAMEIRNLCRVVHGEIVAPSAVYVVSRVLATEKCQTWYDLAVIREATAATLHEALPNVRVEDASRDSTACSCAVTDNATLYEKELRRVLPLWMRARYWGRDYANEIGWTVTAGAAFAGATKLGRVGGLISGVIVHDMVTASWTEKARRKAC